MQEVSSRDKNACVTSGVTNEERSDLEKLWSGKRQPKSPKGHIRKSVKPGDKGEARPRAAATDS